MGVLECDGQAGVSLGDGEFPRGGALVSVRSAGRLGLGAVPGETTPSSCVDPAAAHFPYTFVVPNYTETAFNLEYYGQLSSALATYRANVLASTATPYHKALQLAGIATFDPDRSAVVTTRVQRSGAYGATCAQ